MSVRRTRAPIALLIFNRPDLTARVFAEIARARPETLLVVADGPRPGHQEDPERCAAARAVIERVDWPCNVLTNYSESNLGCAYRPATGLAWVFEQVEEAIILEDDCLPDAAFFPYCDELLDRYRDDQRIMHISGNQFIGGRQAARFSYSFSRYCLSWGWATWRRAFRHYDFEIALWPGLRDTPWLLDILGDQRAVDHWRRIFDVTFSDVDRVNAWWDFQWVFACWVQSGFAVLPGDNLVTNIGCREDATHTKDTASRFANLTTGDLRFPLRHPPYVIRDQDIDRLTFETLLGQAGPRRRIDRFREKCAVMLPITVRQSLASVRSRLEFKSAPSLP